MKEQCRRATKPFANITPWNTPHENAPDLHLILNPQKAQINLEAQLLNIARTPQSSASNIYKCTYTCSISHLYNTIHTTTGAETLLYVSTQYKTNAVYFSPTIKTERGILVPDFKDILISLVIIKLGYVHGEEKDSNKLIKLF